MKDEELIKIVNKHCPVMFSKVTKIFKSHSQDIPYNDCADFFLEFIDDEECFLDKKKMPYNWKSDRAYANCFEALYKCVLIDEIKDYLELTIGKEKTEYLMNRFDELKKKYNNQAKKKDDKQINHEINDMTEDYHDDDKTLTPLDVLKGLVEVETDPVKKYLLDIIVSRFDF